MEIRNSLTHLEWDDKMKNEMATECWNILRGELDSDIDSYVPMKKQGKRSKKKHLSKEAFKKIINNVLYINNVCGGFINIRERLTIIKFTKKY